MSRAGKRAPFRGRRHLSGIDTCVGLKSATGDSGFYEEISVETLCRAKWPLRFVPEIKTERVAMRKRERGKRKRKKKEGEREEDGKEGTTPVMVHEKTNSVILFGRRVKPSM